MKANYVVAGFFFYLSKEYTNSFVVERLSFVHTDAIIKKRGNLFLLNFASSVVCGSET